jgi:DNA-binding transcriptional ArsR family regulator
MIEIEDILSSRGMMKILKILSEYEEMNITQISKKTMLDYRTTFFHLKKLVKAGIIEEKKYDKIRIFKINKKNRIALKIIELIKAWEMEKIFLK